MIQFTLFETLILAGILQAIVLVIVFGQRQKTSDQDKYFFFLIVICSVMLSARLLTLKFESQLVYRFMIFADVTIFLFGPISYIYIKSKLIERFKVNVIHFVPAICHFLFFTWTCFMTSKELSVAYQEGVLYFIFILIETLGLISLCIYLILVLIHLKNFREYNISGLIIAWSLIAIAWLVGYLDSYFLNSTLDVISYSFIWIVIPIWIHLVGYSKLLASSEKVKGPKTSVLRVNKKKQELIVQELEKLTKTSQLFIDIDFKLTDLAREVNASPNELSWVLNKVYKMTFYEFTNKIRVNAFVEKIKNKEHHKKTVLALSLEVGFKSKTAFYNAFKSVYKQTPSEYINNYHLTEPN